MKQLAAAVIGALGLAAGAVLVLRPDEAPRTVEPPAVETGPLIPRPPPQLEQPRPEPPTTVAPPTAPPTTVRLVERTPEAAPDPLEAYVDALGGQVLDVIEQCLADHDTGVTFDVNVDYRLDGNWIVVEAATTTPVIAAVEDCVADRLARVAIEPPPTPERFTRTTFSAGIVHRDERRIETRGRIEWFDS